MINYLINEIDFDVNAFLLEMNNSSVLINRTTYGILIEIYCRCGEMGTVEKIIRTMHSEGMEIDMRLKMHMITGYIISRQSNRVEEIMKENNFDENDKYILIHQGRGYAVLGDTEKIISIINKMKENNFELVPIIYTFYRLLIIANSSEPDLEQIFSLIPGENLRTRITSLICYLNRVGHYNKSLQFVENYKSLLLNRDTVLYLLVSFNSKYCPTNIYESVLRLFSKHIDLSQRNLFANMDFGQAKVLSRNIINVENGNVILTSLLNKAISDKSVHSIKESLRFGIDNLRISKLNLQLQFGFIPSILESGMVSNCEELLNLLPEFKNKILPSVLMHHLCKGNFSEYNNLISHNDKRKPLGYIFGNYPMGTEIIQNVGFEELDLFVLEASKMFNSLTVNDIVSSVITELAVNHWQDNNYDCTAKAVKLAQKFNVTLNANSITRLKEKAELLDSLRILNGNVQSKTIESEIDQTNVD